MARRARRRTPTLRPSPRSTRSRPWKRKFTTGFRHPTTSCCPPAQRGLPSKSIDTRIKNASHLPNGPFQLTGPDLPYDSYTASPVHRFYQMWQQTDCALDHATERDPSGCLRDLFPWVEVTVGAGTNGKPQPADFTDLTIGEGSTSMGFYNMAQGDAPILKSWAEDYTMSDSTRP